MSEWKGIIGYIRPIEEIRCMRIDVFTEGSATLRDDPGKTVLEFFGGGFSSVRTLFNTLSQYGDTTLHVLSDELGHVTGSDNVSNDSGEELSIEDYEMEKRSFRRKMQESAKEADIIVLLFTKDAFRTLVATQWSQLVDVSGGDNIWCIATSESAFDTVDLSQLDGRIIRYSRVGVARIGTETREQLVAAIEERAEAA